MERDGDDRIVKAGDGTGGESEVQGDILRGGVRWPAAPSGWLKGLWTGGPSLEASPCSPVSIGAASGCPDWLVSSAGKTSGVSGTTPLTEGCCCVAAGSRCGCSPDRITCTRTSRVCLSLWGRLPTGSCRGGHRRTALSRVHSVPVHGKVRQQRQCAQFRARRPSGAMHPLPMGSQVVLTRRLITAPRQWAQKQNGAVFMCHPPVHWQRPIWSHVWTACHRTGLRGLQDPWHTEISER